MLECQNGVRYLFTYHLVPYLRFLHTPDYNHTFLSRVLLTLVNDWIVMRCRYIWINVVLCIILSISVYTLSGLYVTLIPHIPQTKINGSAAEGLYSSVTGWMTTHYLHLVFKTKYMFTVTLQLVSSCGYYIFLGLICVRFSYTETKGVVHSSNNNNIKTYAGVDNPRIMTYWGQNVSREVSLLWVGKKKYEKHCCGLCQENDSPVTSLVTLCLYQVGPSAPLILCGTESVRCSGPQRF